MSTETTDDNDRFWDIEKILPPKTNRIFSNDTDTVDVNLNDYKPSQEPSKIKCSSEFTESEHRLHNETSGYNGNSTAEKERTKYTHLNQTDQRYFRHTENKLISELCYKPDVTLIEQVKIWKWPKKYNFYEEFRVDSVKFHSCTATETEKVPFFSFLPQYKNMTDAQMKYYFWWRHNIRKGKCLPADYSYILLFLFEIINLPDLIPSNFGSFLMCVLWFGYREKYPRLDKIVSEWLCDYCLIHNTVPPKRAEQKLAKYGLINCCTPEFYINFDSESKSRHSDHISQALSNYNWRESKYYNRETSEIFEKHIPNALAHAFDVLPHQAYKETHTLSRDAFTGAICTCNIKKRIDIIYNPVLRDPKIRLLITEIVKYSENGVRTLIGASSRFGAKNVSDDVKRAIDEYFSPFIEKHNTEKIIKKKSKISSVTPAVPIYEKLYDSPFDGELSAETAKKIENDSWAITDQLVELLEDTENNSSESKTNGYSLNTSTTYAEKKTLSPSDTLLSNNRSISDSEFITENIHSDRNNLCGSISEEMLKKAVAALLENNKSAFEQTAKKLNLMPDSLVENINEMSYTLIGDISIEHNESGFFTVIDDYRTELEKFAYE